MTGAEALDMVLSRDFDAPVERVWRAFTSEEDVTRWWGPAGFSAPFARMDVREGGSSLVCMRAPAEWGGQDYYNTWSYTAVEPGRRLEYVMAFTDGEGQPKRPAELGLPTGVPDEVPHVVTFEALPVSRTRVTVIESGYGSQDVVDTSRAGMEQCLDKMEALLREEAAADGG